MNPDVVDLLILALIAVNGYVTYRGFKELAFFDRYLFHVDNILIGKQYDRLVTSAFLHVDWRHYGFNMFGLFVFSGLVYEVLGLVFFLVVYTASLLGGNLLSLFFNRNNGDYSAVGASGAVSGIMFASIVIAPESQLGLIFIPIQFPAWIFGAIYMLITLFGVKNKFGNIGHEAHLGGAIAGILTAIAIEPGILIAHPLIVALFLLPFIFFMWVVLKYPEYMLIENYFSKQRETRREDRQRTQRREQSMNAEAELNMLLEKVNTSGIDSLTPAERRRLDELSSNL